MDRVPVHADPFRAIADPTRRAIIDRLRKGPRAVNSLAADFAQSRPAISRHLRVLREAAVITEEKSGRERLYRLRPEALREVVEWVEGYRGFWQSKLTNLKRHLEYDS
jgi:DNA-binding transcriptional ArsR family regulator